MMPDHDSCTAVEYNALFLNHVLVFRFQLAGAPSGSREQGRICRDTEEAGPIHRYLVPPNCTVIHAGIRYSDLTSHKDWDWYLSGYAYIAGNIWLSISAHVLTQK